MNWPYVGFHLCIQFALMMLVLVGVKVVQSIVIDRVVAAWLGASAHEAGAARAVAMESGPFDGKLTSMLFPPQTRQYFAPSSFLFWMLLAFGSSFILHLPSMWLKRVQLFRPARPLDPEWYPRLKKPFWHPPNIFFPLLWIPVRVSRSLGTSLMWEAVGRNVLAPPVIVALVSIVLADIWNQVFFVQHDILGGFGIMMTLSGMETIYAILLTVYAPGAQNFIYSGIFSDLFAACINLSIYRLNRKTTRSVTPAASSQPLQPKGAAAGAAHPANGIGSSKVAFKSE